MNEELKRYYRRQMRWYPKAWRAEYEDVLLGTLLDQAEGDGVREARASFALAGLRARVDQVAAPQVRDAASSVALSMGAGGALITFLVSSWAPWGIGRSTFWSPFTGRFGPFYDLGPLLSALWLVALIAALSGRWRLGRVAVLLTVPMALVMPLISSALPNHALPLDLATRSYSIGCALLAAAGTPRPRPPLALATAGFAGLCWTFFSYERAAGELYWQPTVVLWDRPVWPFHWTALALVTAAVLAITRRRTAAATVLLASLPMLITLDVATGAGLINYNGAPWHLPISPIVLLTTGGILGLAVLILTGRRRQTPVAADRQGPPLTPTG